MRLAVPTDGGQVAQHFGRCPAYTLADINDSGEATDQRVVNNPGHAPGVIPEFLHGLGVDCVIASGIGHKAMNLFDEYGIKVVAGATGDVGQVIEDYLRQNLETEDNLCDHGK